MCFFKGWQLNPLTDEEYNILKKHVAFFGQRISWFLMGLVTLLFCILQARLTAYTSMVDGRVSSSLCVRADGKDRALLEAQLSHSLQRDTRALSLHLTLLQTLLPTTATQLHLNMSANMSSDKWVHSH